MTLDRFSKDKEYAFNCSFSESGMKRGIKYSFELMMRAVFEYLRDYLDKIDRRNKEAFCKAVYGKLRSYRKLLDKEHQAHLTQYKLYVLTAFIAKSFGFGVTSNGADVTNQQLYQGVRYALDKYVDKDGEIKNDG